MICADIDECLQRLEFEDDLAVATSRIHVETLSLRQNIFCFDQSQNIYDYSAAFLIRRDFLMKTQFVDALDNIITSGLISKWRKDLQKHRKSVADFPNVRPLNMADFSYAFIFASFFIPPIVLAAFLEFLIHHKVRSVNAGYFWTVLDRFITGRRYYFLLKQQHHKP